MMHKTSIFLLLLSAFCNAQAADMAEDAPVLFSADLTLVADAATTPSGTPPPFYAKECAKLPSPGTPINASGKASLLYFPKSRTLKYAIAFNALSGPAMMAHFHTSTDSSMPIVQTLCGMPPPDKDGLGHSNHALNGKQCPANNYGFLMGEYVLKGNPTLKMPPEQEVQQLMGGTLFINFHTCLNMGGEIKGAIVPVEKKS